MKRNAAVRLAIGAAVAGALGVTTIAAGADPPTGRYGGTPTYEACKPGNGFGDRNHCHTGPPGQQGKDKNKGPNKARGNKNIDKGNRR